MYNYKHWSIVLLLAFVMISEGFAQTTERVKEIRTMYAKAQADLAEETAIFVKTTIHRNEPAVGLAKHEMTYYPLSKISNGYDFLRAKYQSVAAVSMVYEILYQDGKPAFYFERANAYGNVFEIRVYWNTNGIVDTFLNQQVLEGGKKVNVDYAPEQRTWKINTAYEFASKEYKRGITAYTDYLDQEEDE